MIPYLTLPDITLGPLTLHAWGVCVAIGFLVGGFMAQREAVRRGLSSEEIARFLPLIMFGSMLGGRLFHVVVYDASYYMAHPWEVFAVWEGGLSVFGGFFGALIAVGGAVWIRKLDFHAYADVLAFGLPFGKVFGRLGCFLIHDHPGTLTHSVLGVRYPDGEVRHDLGLYLAINALIMAGFFLWLSRKPRKEGIYLAIFMIWYGVVRFFLDTLRVLDVRYAGLTPAQYLCIAFFFGGVIQLVWITAQGKKQKNG